MKTPDVCGLAEMGNWHPARLLLEEPFGERPLGRGQKLCESGGGRPGLPSLISPRFLWT